MTLWELNDLMAYWKDHPPVHVLVAAYLLGGKQAGSRRRGSRSTGASTSTHNDFNFNDLAREVTFAGGSISNKLPLAYRHA
ncbi:MAG TPA: hypothetical protein VGK22_22025 [Candidatus Angelobacter sp.]|jgi:hypothetical protein